jgi:DNA helicase-2/ATP-dependent DNA helicase PcrA
MNDFSPTLQQKAAIDCDESVIVTACPGSGKTTVMKEKIRKITPELPSHKGVIAITYTKKASEELRDKCKENAHDTKRSFFGTIDSFCLKELILPFLARIWGSEPSECQIVKSLNSHQLLFLSADYSSPTLDNMLNDSGFKKLYDDGILWMNSFSALSLLVLKESLAAQRYIKSRYSHVFIDEYQDSSESQHKLFITLFELGLTAIAVGDVDQSIYRFRGSKPEFLIELTKDSSNFHHFNLDINHRCHPSIVNYASRLLDPNYQLLTHDDEINVYRILLDGNLENAGVTITSWISEWLDKGDIEHASDVAILGKKENSLKQIATGLNIDYRLYIDTPLNFIGTQCADLYTDLLLYKFKAISTAQDLIEKHISILATGTIKIPELRRRLKALRAEDGLDCFIEQCNYFAALFNLGDTPDENEALKVIWGNETLLKLFKPKDQDEVQVMTLHKSKGLEFKIVLHFDLEEWSFPHRIPGANWEDVNYPSLEQDTNLHYVGITRAEQCCVLIRTSLRQNASGGYGNSRPSYFLGLDPLEGLYQ